jgi:Mitochondrial K+-H+ exchange-related
VSRGVVLRGAGRAELRTHVLVLGAVAVISLTIGAVLFRKRLGGPLRNPPRGCYNAGDDHAARPRRVTDRIVKIYLLSIDGRRCFFYADESEPPDVEAGGGPGHAGWRARLLERWNGLRAAWEHSEAKAARWTLRAWEWLHSWSHPDEVMLVRLRSARRIELHHPVSRGPDEVRKLWVDYLNHRWWRHVLWMGANGIVAPPALVFLWPLPGPNVIGYWFAYRAIHHALIVLGIRRLRRGRIPIELHPRDELDRPIEHDENGKAKHAAFDGDAPRLDEHVAWTETESPNTDPAEEQ